MISAAALAILIDHHEQLVYDKLVALRDALPRLGWSAVTPTHHYQHGPWLLSGTDDSSWRLTGPNHTSVHPTLLAALRFTKHHPELAPL